MEARCERFMLDAKRPPDAKTPKEIAKLRSFLFKNQSNRFTAGEQEHLFQAVSLYATAAASAAATAGPAAGDPEDSPALGLIEDALKMPFTVFTTAHKKAFLKWMDKLQQQAGGAAGGGGGAAAAAGPPKARHTVIDLTADSAEIMDEDGETLTICLSACPRDLADQIRRGYEAGQEVRVALAAGGGGSGGGTTPPSVAAVEVS